jgi:hypothetical protein
LLGFESDRASLRFDLPRLVEIAALDRALAGGVFRGCEAALLIENASFSRRVFLRNIATERRSRSAMRSAALLRPSAV